MFSEEEDCLEDSHSPLFPIQKTTSLQPKEPKKDYSDEQTSEKQNKQKPSDLSLHSCPASHFSTTEQLLTFPSPMLGHPEPLSLLQQAQTLQLLAHLTTISQIHGQLPHQVRPSIFEPNLTLSTSF